MTSPTSDPDYPGPAYIPGTKPPGYAEATVLEAQSTDKDASLPAYSPSRPPVPWPGQSEAAVLNVERSVRRRARLGERRIRTLACFILLAFLLVAIFIVVVIIEVVGHLDQ